MNLIVPPPVYDRYRALVRGEPLLLARGRFERVDRNRNVLVEELVIARAARPPASRTTPRCAPRFRRLTTSAIGSVEAHGRPALTLAPGGARGRGRRRLPELFEPIAGRRLHRRRRLHGPLDGASDQGARAGRGRRRRRAGHLRRRAVRAKRRLRALVVVEDLDADQARRRGGGFPVGEGIRGGRRGDRGVLRARGSGRALPPGRLALDGDRAGPGRCMGVERRGRRGARLPAVRAPERRGGAEPHGLADSPRRCVREDGGDRAAGAACPRPAPRRARARHQDLRADGDGRARPRGRRRPNSVGLGAGRRDRPRSQRLGDEDPGAHACRRRSIERHGRDGADAREARRRAAGRAARPSRTAAFSSTTTARRRTAASRSGGAAGGSRSGAASTRTSTTTGARPASSRRSS